MLTQIFTGHTIELGDLRAVSPVMCQINPGSPFCYQTMYVEIHLRDGVTLRHEAIKMQTIHNFEMEPEQARRWAEMHDETTARRDDLVKQWQVSCK